MFPTIESCSSVGRENHTVVADMDGTLLIGRSAFPYFAAVAFDVGGPIRLVFLLLTTPLIALLYHFISESAGIRVMFFATFVGAKVKDIETVARSVLPKLYARDLHPETWRLFSTCGRRCVLTANARIMVEPFLKEYLGTDLVLGTEIAAWRGRATGLVSPPGVLVGEKKAEALKKAFGDNQPEIGLGDRETDFPFMSLCKEGYTVVRNPRIKAVNIGKILEGSRRKGFGYSAREQHLTETVSSSICRIVSRIG